jgi:hypothetical protein
LLARIDDCSMGGQMLRRPNSIVTILAAAGLLSFGAGAQAADPVATPIPGATAASNTEASKSVTPTTAAAMPGLQITADLRQLMRGIFFSASNVVFAAQDDVGKIKQAEDAAVSPNPLTSIYGGWEAVQDAAVTLSDASNLLLLPGRLCSNGQAVPVNRPDWAGFVQTLRNASARAYQAALTKNTDQMVTVSYTLSLACDACHKAYRDKYQKLGNQKVCKP